MNMLEKALIPLFIICFASLPMAAVAADPKPVIDVTYVNVNGDVKGFLALVAKGREIGKKLRPKADVKVYVYYASKAGAYSGTVAVVTEHSSYAEWAQGQQIVMASPQWQALMQEFTTAGYKPVSSGLSVELMRYE
jgi:hypothetical protein